MEQLGQKCTHGTVYKYPIEQFYLSSHLKIIRSNLDKKVFHFFLKQLKKSYSLIVST